MNGAITRLVILTLTIINSVLNHYGYQTLPFTDEFVSQVVADVLLVGSALWSWWRNNSITYEAKEADKLLKEMKRVK